MDRDRDARGRRFDDGEVVRYGAGESWRPTPRGGSGSVGDRSPPRRPRSPPRDRQRSPRGRSSSRPRVRSPGAPGSDCYVPGRYPPRRRSRSSEDRFRRDRSGGRASPRRRERTRSPARRSPPRRSPSRRVSPIRNGRYDRPRSPRRDWDQDRDRDWDRDRARDRDRAPERRRSRSPFGRERRDRSPAGRSTPLSARGGSYRPRSRSHSRGPDRYQSQRRSPLRDSGVSSAIPSQTTSARPSPRPGSVRARSPLHSRDHSPYRAGGSGPGSTRDGPASSNRSPPRGPAALRGPPAGPGPRTLSTSVSSPLPIGSKYPQTPGGGPQRADAPSPTNAPSGPRGYAPSSRGGGYSSRGGRSSGLNQPPSRQLSRLSPAPSTPTGSSTIPTGPRGAGSNNSASSTPTHGRPFNPPTGPATQHGGGPRQSLAQSVMSTMPVVIPGGKLDPSMTPVTLGVTRDLETHYRKLRDEEEKARDELQNKQEKLRKSLYLWDRLDRDARAWELRSDLSEKSMKNLAGEGMGGAAF